MILGRTQGLVDILLVVVLVLVVVVLFTVIRRK